jgi:ribose 5-phosphate isomerase A
MSDDLSPIDRAKRAAAARAAQMVESGMRVGLGTGSTAAWMLRALAERRRHEGLDIVGVPTSGRTAELARELGIPVTPLDEAQWVDLTIDGADEVDGALNLIKGGGGALLMEKIVATASDRMVVIADPAKEVAELGAFPLPLETVPFGWRSTRALVAEILSSLGMAGRDVTLRMNGAAPFVTDEGNYILDLHLERIRDARQLALVLNQVPGVVENGLFLDICDAVVVGLPDGRTLLREAEEHTGRDDNIFADLSE